MSGDADAVELYRKYRPANFGQVIGQEDAMRAISDMGKRNVIPHCLLFVGPSGCGKTTLARILRKKLGCSDGDFSEMNIADFRGIDMVRDLRQRMSLAPLGGKCRVWLLDECHKLTPDAQEALLKVLEDTPSHVYFFLCSTDPQKLKATVRTRCTEIKLKGISEEKLSALVRSIAEQEGKQLSDAVVARVADRAEGSARKALVILHAVIGLPDEAAQLKAVDSGDYRAAAIEIARLLMNSKAQWADVAKVITALGDEEEPESLRYMVLGYAKACILKGGPIAARAHVVISAFQYNFYDSKMPGFVAACYGVVTGK